MALALPSRPPADATAQPPTATTEVREVSLLWRPQVPTWVLLAASLWLFAATLWALRVAAAAHERPLRRRRRWAAGARLLGGLALLVAAAGPELASRRGIPEPRAVAVVIDNSSSMVRPAAEFGDGATAAAAVRAELARELAPMRPLFFDLRGPVNEAGAVAATAGESPLVEAVERAAAERGASLAGVVLVSDGIDTTGRAEASSTPLTDDARRRLRALALPVSTVATGSHGAFDLALVRVNLDPVVFVKTTVELDCVVATRGPVPGPVAVELWHAGARVGEQVLAVAPGTAELHARFPVRAERVAEAVYTCLARPQAGERNPDNNARTAVLRPVRDKVRVLHVAGRPSYDERFLRQALQEDRNVEVVSFFILRTPHSDSSVPERELSLIPFPVGRLFTEELRNFDAVVLQNFDFRPYAMAQYLGNLREAVRGQGLGLLVLGGEEGLGGGGYAGTPLEDVSPLALRPVGQNVPPAAPAAGTPRLTAAGRHHPVLALTPTEPGREPLLRALPPLVGLDALGATQPGAQVLLEASFEAAGGRAWPLVAAREVGRGRALLVATDGLWRWAYAPRGPEAGPRAYRQLWRNAWRWLTHDPELGRLRLALQSRELTAGPQGAVVRGEVRVLDEAWQPAAGTALRLWATPHPQADLRQPADAVRGTLSASTLHANVDGRAPVALGPLAAGVWQVCVAQQSANSSRPKPTTAPNQVVKDVVEEVADEIADQLGPRRDCAAVVVHPPIEATLDADGDAWLAAVAEATGGVVRRAAEVVHSGLRPTIAPPPPLRVAARNVEPLAGHPALLGTVLLGLGLAAWLGRRAGGR